MTVASGLAGAPTCTVDGLPATVTGSSSPYSVSVSGQGIHPVSCSVDDNAGNTGTGTDSVKIDTIAPVNVIDFPLDGGIYSEASWNLGCSTPLTGDLCGSGSDTGGSGLANVKISLKNNVTLKYYDFGGTDTFNSSDPVYATFTPGTIWNQALPFSKFSGATTYTLVSKATDNASNTTTRSATFTINVIDIDYLTPLDDSTPTAIIKNTGKNGRVIPVKVNVYANGVIQTNTQIAAAALTIKVIGMTCGSTAAVDPVETYADAGMSNAGTNEFRASGNGWIYNLDTTALKLSTGNCYRLDVYLDGVKISTQHFAVFQPIK